jgi:hypothetical protein
MGKVAEMALEGCEPRDAGITGVLVRTGKFRPDALAQQALPGTTRQTEHPVSSYTYGYVRA